MNLAFHKTFIHLHLHVCLRCHCLIIVSSAFYLTHILPLNPIGLILADFLLFFLSHRTFPPCQLMDLKVFVDTDSDERLARRLRRDIADRGRELGDVLQQYHRFVKPAYDQFIAPTMTHADIIVPRGEFLKFGAVRLFSCTRCKDLPAGKEDATCSFMSAIVQVDPMLYQRPELPKQGLGVFWWNTSVNPPLSHVFRMSWIL